MRNLFIFTLLSIFQISAFAQDTIVLKSKREIIVKVIEVSSELIKYKAFKRPDGPIRNIKTFQITTIKYENGFIETFDVEPPPKVEEVRKPKPYKDLLFSNGFFIEGHFTMVQDEQMVPKYLGLNADPKYDTIRKKVDYGSIGIHFGFRFNFTQRKIWRPGLQIAIFRFGMILRDSDLESILGNPLFSFQPLNVTYCNIFKLKQNTGIELNFSAWPIFHSRPNMSEGGLAIALQTKYRFKGFTIGIDYQYTDIMFSNRNELLNSQSYSIVIGRKF